MKCTNVSTQVLEPGVSHELAKIRKKSISNLKYKLSFSIPERQTAAITGAVVVEFDFNKNGEDLVLDFQSIPKHVLSVLTNGENNAYTFKNEHIIIPDESLVNGRNWVDIKFISGNSSLNRNEAYLYTLFVPDKASIVFPCFDQPDIKANYQLELSTPESWTAMSNGSIVKEEVRNSIREFEFSETGLISTYHFAFIAGKFEKLSRTKGGRTINIYHREQDSLKLKRNIDTIFSMHFMALDWMEEYTEVKYPFEKLDFAVIPSFQFKGMEHAGAIFYRNTGLFLSESASADDVFKRASLIMHEVSHMWFGDLVTMEWFDDVWLKEVYAELMASKMVKPMFPEVNSDLNFITAIYPRAYQADRTQGTLPIKQKLDNMKYAGTLYGDIIYKKSPIVMAKLELIVGEKALQDGLREYLRTYKYGNAAWEDLIEILDKYTKLDLNDWSRMWVEQEGMPEISSQIEYGKEGVIHSCKIRQKDLFGKGRVWTQNFEVLWYKDGEYKFFPVFIENDDVDIEAMKGLEEPDFILLNGSGYGYGYFVLDKKSMDYLLNNMHEIDNDIVRTVSYISLFQALVNYNLEPAEYITKVSKLLKNEPIKQNIQMVLSNLDRCWWSFLDQNGRLALVEDFEKELFNIAKNNSSKETKSAIFKTLVSVSISKKSQDYFYHVWKEQGHFFGLKPSGTDYSTIALALSLRGYQNADSILNEQLARIDDYDRKEYLRFIMPSVSVDEKIRDKFFQSLKKPENRQQEIWVRTGLLYLNHPLRAKSSLKYLPETLEMLEEIQKTGDIFFPKNWLAYSIGRHNSKEAAGIVTQFLDERPNYNENLRAKILQLSDYLFRAEKMNEQEEQYGNEAPGFNNGNE